MERMSQHTTLIERTRIEDCRRRMEERIKLFNRKADTLMGLTDLDEIVPSIEKGDQQWEELHEWDDVLEEWGGIVERSEEDQEEEKEKEDEGASENEESKDDDDAMEYPEQLSLSLPSSFGRELIEVHGLQMLASQEIQLRVGQANDVLGDLRVELGHKALLFRTRIRYTKNTKGKTRVWKDVARSSMEVIKHVQRYQRARGS